MLMRAYRAYHDWMVAGMRSFQHRHIKRAEIRGRLTKEMASNRRAFSEVNLRIWPIQAPFTLAYFVYAGCVFARVIEPQGIVYIILLIVIIPYCIYIFPKSLHHSRIERRLRREAILDGQLRARFPDRIWAWNQRRAQAGA